MKKAKKSNKIKAIIAIILSAIVIALIVLAVVALVRSREPELNGDTIDCQPPLNQIEAEKCQKAKERGYPKIVY